MSLYKKKLYWLKDKKLNTFFKLNLFIIQYFIIFIYYILIYDEFIGLKYDLMIIYM